MEISLYKEQTLKQVQEEFQAQFPKLKIEFFKHQHGEGDGSPLNDLIDPNTKLGSIMGGSNTHFDFDAAITVAELESTFREYFGLNIQVFRKSGDVWIQTTLTDDWTLMEEEEVGEEMSKQNEE